MGQEACTFHKGDLVSARYVDNKMHPGQITGVLPSGKFEVTLKDFPVVIARTASDIQRAVEAPHPAPTFAKATSVPSATRLAAKFSDVKIFGTKVFRPESFVGADIGRAVTASCRSPSEATRSTRAPGCEMKS